MSNAPADTYTATLASQSTSFDIMLNREYLTPDPGLDEAARLVGTFNLNTGLFCIERVRVWSRVSCRACACARAIASCGPAAGPVREPLDFTQAWINGLGPS